MFSALAHSIDDNYLTHGGQNMSGILKLAEALPHSQLTSLRWPTRPLNFAWTFVPLLAFASAARDMHFDCMSALRCSLKDNRLDDDAKTAIEAAAGSHVKLAL